MLAWVMAAVRLAAPFTDGAVLQRETRVPVWGTAEAGETVRVSFARQEKTTVASPDGKWRVDLDPMRACADGQDLKVNGLTVRDVLVGEVWLCSGQSNMGVPFWGDSPRARDRFGGQVGQIMSRPLLRIAHLGNGWSDVPRTDESVVWRKTTPDYLLHSGISAVAVWYGLYLQGALGVPVGLFGAYVGATDIETWTPDCPTPCPESRKDMNGQKPSQYHNGKVAPICPYAMRGAIWYQGESNTYRTEIPKYAGKMRDLLYGWKRVFENPGFRLYFAQICPWGDPLVPWMQEEQAKFAASEPDAGMAVLCDAGNLQDIHPNEKEVVGLRLALLALKRDYGFSDIVADSPTLKSWKVEDGRFVMTFDNVREWSLYDPDWRIHRTPTNSVEYGFEVCGADGKWVKAQIGNLQRVPNVKHVEYRGQITNRELVVFSPEVREPKGLRYLHSRPWRGYLMNEVGLPVGAFHIDGKTAARGIRKVPLKENWKFIKADDPKYVCEPVVSNEVKRLSALLDRADRGDLSGAFDFDWARPDFDDSAWQDVRVPHDWGVMKSYDPDRPYGDAFLDVTGVGWYRTSFNVDVPERGKVLFECDGAMSFSQVFVNGRFVGGWPYGYTRFQLDLTPYLNRGGNNLLAIRCHNVSDSSRWYTGGGLYRNCRLLVCPEDHVVPGSVFITTPEVTRGQAKVRVRYEMSKSGKRDYSFTVKNPRLWDVDDPHLYEIDIEGNVYKYGIRTIAFHSDERRFQLNGRTVPLNGVSMHHEFGVLGAAWNRTAQRRRLKLFKEAGVNAIRSSHNPPDEGLLELCDEMGILVKSEVFDTWRMIGDGGKRVNDYHLLFDTWHERDTREWIRVGRNHPCVILYSLGNEICDLRRWAKNLKGGIATMRRLAVIATEEDPTRPSCVAHNETVNFTNECPTVLGVMGCNYGQWQFPRLKAKYPDVPFFGTESICTMSSRGEYRFPVVKRSLRRAEFDSFYMSSYCWESCGWTDINADWACPPDVQWYWMDVVGTCMGDFPWTGIDYLGGPFYCDDMRKKPRFADPVLQAQALADVKKYGMSRTAIHSCSTGFLDLAGFKKDLFYLYQSRFLPEKPMAHILPHWNWPERGGRVTPVYVFTSGDEGELFLNGKSLGRQKKQPGAWDRAYRLCWDEVRYAPGRLEAVVYRNGREWARDVVETTGKPARLDIEAESKQILSDGEDVCYVNVSLRDAEGRIVPRARTMVAFSVEGPGEVVATDNGDETDMSDFRKSEHAVFNGWVQALVRARPGAKGRLRIKAAAKGLAPVEVEVEVVGVRHGD